MNKAPWTEPHEGISAEAAVDGLHEHQVELVRQTVEMRGLLEGFATSLKRYFELYDLAPVGYLTLDNDALVRLPHDCWQLREHAVHAPKDHLRLPAREICFLPPFIECLPVSACMFAHLLTNLFHRS